MKKRANGEGTKSKILVQSAELFAELGFNGVTMRDISRKVGVTLPSIYHHFGNKQALYRAVETEFYGRVRDRLLSTADSSDDPRQRLQDTLVSLYDAMRADAVFHTILVRNLLYSSAENRKFLTETTLQPIFDYVDGLVQSLGVKEHKVTAVTMLSALVGVVTMKAGTCFLKRYPYANSRFRQERDYCIAAVMKLVDQHQ